MTVGGTVNRYLASLMAVPVAASLLLAACGGDAKPDTSPSPSLGSSPTTTTPAPMTASASATTAGPKTDSHIPAAARAHTPVGAEAFVRYFYSQLNIAFTTPKAELISALSIPTCRTCKAFERAAADLAAKRQHYRGDAFALRSVGATDESDVVVVGEQPPGAVIDINGSVVKSRTNAQPAKFIVTVTWSSDRWRIHEIRLMT
jgi:hypothetical protein